MSTMSKPLSIFLASAIALSAFSAPLRTVSAADAQPAKDVVGYATQYEANVDLACQKWNPRDGAILKVKTAKYPEIGSPTAVASYKRFLAGTENFAESANFLARAEKLYSQPYDESIADLGVDATIASSFYKLRMSQVFSCGMINHKIGVHETLLKTIKGKRQSGGNLMKKLEAQTKALTTELSNRGCAKRDTDDKLYREKILTQATYEYCNYRHYLRYVKLFSDARSKQFIDSEIKRAEKL